MSGAVVPGYCPRCERSNLDDTHDFKWLVTSGERRRQRECKECRRAGDRAYYDKNAKRIQRRAYARKTPEQRRDARKRTKQWVKDHPDHARALWFYNGIHRRYGISVTRYLVTIEQQGHRCARCRASQWGRGRITRPHVDHDHTTKQFRGLLCMRCNHLLGSLGDNVAGVRREASSYIAYLEGRL